MICKYSALSFWGSGETFTQHTSASESRRWLQSKNPSYLPQQLNVVLWAVPAGCGVSYDVSEPKTLEAAFLKFYVALILLFFLYITGVLLTIHFEKYFASLTWDFLIKNT
jgi:hypothetical protein